MKKLITFAIGFLLLLALASCSKRVVSEVGTGRTRVIKVARWANVERGDTLANNRNNVLYVVKH